MVSSNDGRRSDSEPSDSEGTVDAAKRNGAERVRAHVIEVSAPEQQHQRGRPAATTANLLDEVCYARTRGQKEKKSRNSLAPAWIKSWVSLGLPVFSAAFRAAPSLQFSTGL